MRIGMLILFSGKMGAGKSTMARQISRERNAVLISEDEWLSRLYPNQIGSFPEYLHYATLLKPIVKSLVISMLRGGTSVVMDFPANTIKQRAWFREMLDEVDAPNELIFLNASDDICLMQIEKRRSEQPERAIFDTEMMFKEVSKYFQPPEESEGFSIRKLNGNPS